MASEPDFDTPPRAIHEAWPGTAIVGVSKIAGRNQALLGIVDERSTIPEMRNGAIILDKMGLIELLGQTAEALNLMTEKDLDT